MTLTEEELKLEYRMYGLVPYNISPIQQAIQFGHAVVEYSLLMRKSPQHLQDKYYKWAEQDKTFIILNGGTTNENPMNFGTLQNHNLTLLVYGIQTATFREPDLNNALTAVVFLVDERVFNRDKYPDWIEPVFVSPENEKAYSDWVQSIGGEKNRLLRAFLPTFRKA